MKSIAHAVLLFSVCLLGIACEGGEVKILVDGKENQKKSSNVKIKENPSKPGVQPGTAPSTNPNDPQNLEEIAGSDNPKEGTNGELSEEIDADQNGEKSDLDKEEENNEIVFEEDAESLEVNPSGIRSECIGTAMNQLKALMSGSIEISANVSAGGWGSKNTKKKTTQKKASKGWGSSNQVNVKTSVNINPVGWGSVSLPQDFLANCLISELKRGPKIAKDEQYVIIHLENNQMVEAKKLKDLNTTAITGAAGYAQCVNLAKTIEGDSSPMKIGQHVCSSGACCIKLF